MITIESLSKSYGNTAILKDIYLSFDASAVHGIVGKNGAGKTTLFNCLAGIETYDGSINFTEGKLREASAYLQTNPYMMSHITGREYLRLVANAKGIPVLDEQIAQLFELPLERYASTYSTGMKKKLALIGLLLQQNKVFLLDEPFNGVDLESNLVIQALIMRLKALNKHVIIASHIFQTLEKSCDVIHHLENGQIIQSYLPSEFHLVEGHLGKGEDAVRIEELKL